MDPDPDLICAFETQPGELAGVPKLKGGPLLSAEALGTVALRVDYLHERLEGMFNLLQELAEEIDRLRAEVTGGR